MSKNFEIQVFAALPGLQVLDYTEAQNSYDALFGVFRRSLLK